MKLHLLVLVLIASLSSCTKDDKVYTDLIQGKWGKQVYNKIDGDIGFQKLHFQDNGYYKIFVRKGDTIDRCEQLAANHLKRDSLRYFIEEGHLFKQDPYASQENIIEYRIIKLNDNKLNIVVADKDNDQSISDRLRNQEIYQRCED